MTRSNPLACGLLIVGILLLITRSTRADSLIIANGQTIQLGLPGVATNYSYTSITVQTGGTLKIAGVVGLVVTSDVLIDGNMVGGSVSNVPAGTNGGGGANGVVMGGLAGPGGPGANGANGTNGVGVVALTIYAQNMIVNGSILFNPQANGGDGGDGGAAGNGANGLSPGPGGLSGGYGGDGGAGGVGGYGGDSVGGPFLTIILADEPDAGSFILGANGLISLDNMGGGGAGGSGGAGGAGGTGGNGAGATGAADGGAGGNGVPAGFGGTGGVGGGAGTLSITAVGIDLEGTIYLRGGNGGNGGNLGTPRNGGNGGDGGPSFGPGGNGGNAGDASFMENPGGVGGNGGSGGYFFVEWSMGFTNFAEMDFSGGYGGDGGAGQPANVGMGGTGGSGAGGEPSGQNGAPSAYIPNAVGGLAGEDGSMSESNPDWGTEAPDGWQLFGKGILTFGFTNNIHTLILSSTNGPFSIVGQLSDPRYQYDSGAGESIVETNEPVELQFAYRWLSTSGSVDVLLGDQVVLQLNAPAVLASGFTESSLILTGLPAEASDELSLTFQLNTSGPAQFQLGDPSLQALPQLPFISIGPSPTNSTALSLSWFGTTNENYQVQYSTSLGSGAWMNLGSVVPGQGAAVALALPVAPGDPARFYRLTMTPAN